MPTSCIKTGRIAAIVALLIVCATSAWAGGRWRVGDVVVCFGGGTCQMLQPGAAPTTVILDTISDSGAVTSSGSTRGVSINNTLHVLVSDAGASSNLSNVVEYQIAGEDPLGNPVAHGVTTVFNSNGVGGIQSIALDNGGDMYILNANNGSPNIVELNPSGVAGTPISLATNCGISQVSSMDLSADGSSAYVSSGGTIQKITLASGACTVFASFGSGVSLYGIRDIPAGASSRSGDETVLVVAKGFIDPNNDNDGVNICTDQMDGNVVSCALLLDTMAPSGPGLNAPTWQGGHLFNSVTILDKFLQIESVFTPGTSGGDEPTWSNTNGGITRDNAVIWTDQGQKLWHPSTVYAVGNVIVDPAGHVQQVIKVKATDVSGSSQPAWNDAGGTTQDNKVTWQDRGGWAASHAYASGAMVGSPAPGQHVELATTAGTSGPSQPAWPNVTSQTIVDGLQWINGGTSPSVVARYVVTGQTTLQALALDPLVSTQTQMKQNCSGSPVSCTAADRTVQNFWMADSISGNFFRLDFATGTPVLFSTTVPNCTGCSGGIESIGLYGAEDGAQPGLTQFPTGALTNSGAGTTNTLEFDFSPDGNDDNQFLETGYNFPSGGNISLTAYATAINSASGISDSLQTPTPGNPILVPPQPCSPTTSMGQCVVWELDNDPVPQNSSCATNPDSCAFLGVQLELYNGTTLLPPNFNAIAAVDQQYDVTDSVDTVTHYTNSEVSLHTVTPDVQGATNCTYQPPLSPSTAQPAACLTTSRNNIPFKFQCTNLPTGTSQASLLPFLHIVESNGVDTEPLLALLGTGGTTNYRFDSTGQQWVFNLNNPGLGDYTACTEDATHTVESFCTNFNVQNSCP